MVMRSEELSLQKTEKNKLHKGDPSYILLFSQKLHIRSPYHLPVPKGKEEEKGSVVAKALRKKKNGSGEKREILPPAVAVHV